MRKVLFVSLIFSAVACSSGGNTETSQNGADTTTIQGNSAGSNIIEMDTLHMDTSSQQISTDNVH